MNTEQIKAAISAETDKIFDEVVALRREFHRYPELAYEEVRTAGIVAEYLEGLGLEVQRGVAKTGVVAHLNGAAANGSSKVVALRADLDALPMPEETTHAFRSAIEGRMHACGHDAHTATLLGAAKVLSSLRAHLQGTVKFIFQPSEEKIPGGAKPMLEAGIFKDRTPDAVFGQHCMPQVPVGKVGFYAGAMMAAADELYITVKGRGGHGSAPHRTSDPIVAAVQIVTSLQTIVSRNMPPAAPVVVSITAIHGGSATNIIPNEVHMMGTLRTMDETVRELAHTRLKDIVHFTGKAMGVEAEIEIRKGYPVLINDKAMTEFAFKAAQEYLGEEHAVHAEPVMGAEDFAYFLQVCPGTFWQLGVGNAARGIVHNIHSTQFDIDEEALRVGTGFMSYLAWKFLSSTMS
ncbi:MAG: M20 family metallopeptidase [Chloroherpetonaceae bacterium]|nr:M20 family metallopeptidase [Chloroherpetonaceae bacterium]MCS7210535.1 M20 family metallopeptidase [Chloroherpetonaceae bacterium]MDW8020982.1 M20 family metallopeptidase [Chloroherpetonaceae bacterium]MDW8467179.1 M20 family metallopeptidase [Chloroherpetonaceae bacterium]